MSPQQLKNIFGVPATTPAPLTLDFDDLKAKFQTTDIASYYDAQARTVRKELADAIHPLNDLQKIALFRLFLNSMDKNNSAVIKDSIYPDHDKLRILDKNLLCLIFVSNYFSKEIDIPELDKKHPVFENYARTQMQAARHLAVLSMENAVKKVDPITGASWLNMSPIAQETWLQNNFGNLSTASRKAYYLTLEKLFIQKLCSTFNLATINVGTSFVTPRDNNTIAYVSQTGKPFNYLMFFRSDIADLTTEDPTNAGFISTSETICHEAGSHIFAFVLQDAYELGKIKPKSNLRPAAEYYELAKVQKSICGELGYYIKGLPGQTRLDNANIIRKLNNYILVFRHLSQTLENPAGIGAYRMEKWSTPTPANGNVQP